jgi:hypothetical protein
MRSARTVAALAALLLGGPAAGAASVGPDEPFNHSHCHLTNFVQEGPTMQRFLEIMGDTAGRVAIFGSSSSRTA